mmetsp:Transcript_36893/g.68758  ORF Transcript_36893/g.68758 Transcript_36893/m.68758 type:complete len:368 (-) Transcript_36893:185-1288(-)
MGKVMMNVMDDVHLVDAANMRCFASDDSVGQTATVPGSWAPLVLFLTAPVLLGRRPAVVPVLETGITVVVSRLQDMLGLDNGDILHNCLGRHRNRDSDNSAWIMHSDGNRLLDIGWRRWHRLRHVMLVQDRFVDDVWRTCLWNLDQGAWIVNRHVHDVVDFTWRRRRHHFLHRHSHVVDGSDGPVVIPVLHLGCACLLVLVAAVALVLWSPHRLPVRVAFCAFIGVMLHIHLVREDFCRRSRDWHSHRVGDVLCPHSGVILVVQDHTGLCRIGVNPAQVCEAFCATACSEGSWNGRQRAVCCDSANAWIISTRIYGHWPKQVDQEAKQQKKQEAQKTQAHGPALHTAADRNLLLLKVAHIDSNVVHG